MKASSGLIDRRAFLAAAGAGFLSGLTSRSAFALTRADAVYATGYRDADRRFGLALMSERGDFIDRIDLPDRMHGLCHSPATGRVVAFARRPGTFAMILDTRGHSEPIVIHAAENRHFFGHGHFSPDGRILYASENDFEAGRGVIGLYDGARGFARIGEFPAHGIGTHDMTVSDDGALLIIANGGIETHPDFGRTKLNLDAMQPSLVIADARDGRLIEKHLMPNGLEQLSTRHLAVMDRGEIWFACQYEGARNDLPPLVGRFGQGVDLRFAELPEDTTTALANYVGAIAVHRTDRLVGLASPKGGVAVTLSATSGKVVATQTIPDAAGIAPARHGFAVSSYRGDFDKARQPVAFDQHIVRTTAA
ncbi:DUF1513 domain-containing protein [Rhizobium halophytocola]|uniref:DUF1513 domain-containing protein n=1 Tax=Rhizobium halophytocola TaxID=735519 RepID=A0ABS4E0F1_9HYPH|nr:DUF1513 domain-containing protein [Rhizobium halophytocola]MBP1851418.1 hypothetical protein [Rhizobium halophytocola]